MGMIIKDDRSAMKAMDELAKQWAYGELERGSDGLHALGSLILLGMDLALASPEWADSILSLLLQHDRGGTRELSRLLVQKYPVSVSL